MQYNQNLSGRTLNNGTLVKKKALELYSLSVSRVHILSKALGQNCESVSEWEKKVIGWGVHREIEGLFTVCDI